MLLQEYIKHKKYKLVLASQSPRRKQLLTEGGFEFTTRSMDVDESYDSSMEVTKIAAYISEKKAKAYMATMQQNEIIITSDTTVVLGNEQFGKPANREEAYAMLRALSGSPHQVITAVTFSYADQMYTFNSTTLVYIKELSDEEIYYYIDTYKPFDKAGAYGIQEWLGMNAISKIEGCYFNVVGLPMADLVHHLSIFVKEID